jgi:hypothetical protein
VTPFVNPKVTLAIYSRFMLFLMNDTILDFSLRAVIPPNEEGRLRSTSYADVLNEGARMFRDKPNFHLVDSAAAKRLAALIVAKAPDANAALFDTKSTGKGTLVKPLVVSLSIEVLANLYAEFKADRLTRDMVDQRIWSRLPRPAAA